MKRIALGGLCVALWCLPGLIWAAPADSDSDGIPDSWELNYPCMLVSTPDEMADYEPDGLANIHEYFNDGSLDGNTSDPCDATKPKPGAAGGGYFGDADGDSVIGIPDLNRLNLRLNSRSADYSKAFPADPIVQDMDGDMVIGIPDKNLLSLLLNGRGTDFVAGSPTTLELVEPVTPPTKLVGETVRIKVKLIKDDAAKPRAGFGVVFTIVGGSATLLGGEGISGSGRYDLTALDGVAQMVVMVTGAGLIEVKVELPYDSEMHTRQVNLANVEINGDNGCPDGDVDGFDDLGCGGTDCNDGNPDIYPGALEICFDGVDNQCPGDPGYGLLDEGCICTSTTSSCWPTTTTTTTLNCWPTSSCHPTTSWIHTTFSSSRFTTWTTCIPGSTCSTYTGWTTFTTCSTYTTTFGCTHTAGLTLFPSPTKMALNGSRPGNDHGIALRVAQAIDKILKPGPLAAAEDQNPIPAGGRRRAAVAGNLAPLSYGTLAVEEQWLRGRYDDATHSWGLGDILDGEDLAFLSVGGPVLDYQVAVLGRASESCEINGAAEPGAADTIVPAPAPEELNGERTTGKFQAKFSFMVVNRPH